MVSFLCPSIPLREINVFCEGAENTAYGLMETMKREEACCTDNNLFGVCERRTAMAEFRRRQNSDRWHWSKDCSNYPTEKDVIISHTLPGYGSLCEECKKKAPLEKEK